MRNTSFTKRKIAVITGTRAEYGLLYLLLKEIQSDPELQLQLIVTGMHLSSEFGLTYQLIEQDGFAIDAKVEMLLSSNTASGVAKSVGLGVIGFTDTFSRLQPDIIVILGDRFEMLSAAQAALFLKIPIAHIHGGELSLGALDDSIRHCITKMARWHFTAAKPYQNRVIQMGEAPETVFNTGAPGIERMKKIKLHARQELEKILDFRFSSHTFLVAYHPETVFLENISHDLAQIFSALDLFPDAKIIMTKSNSDESGVFVNNKMEYYAKCNPDRVKLFTTMGDLNYLSTLRLVNCIIGNSSSGIIEAPVFHVPTVNIGSRQLGRLRAASVIDCDVTRDAIFQVITKALSTDFQKIANNTVSPYDGGETSIIIKNILKKLDLKKHTQKKFYDIETKNEADLCYR